MSFPNINMDRTESRVNFLYCIAGFNLAIQFSVIVFLLYPMMGAL